jgi:membrane fusion protein, multidrug efflux system
MSEETSGNRARPRPARRKMLIAIGGLGMIILAALATGVFGSESGAEAGGGPAEFVMPPMPVDVAEVRQEDVVDVVRATGRIEAVHSVELRPDEQGRIVEFLFREGQAVREGAPLIRIDDAMLRAQAERARADRDLAHQQLERVRRLHGEGAAPPAELERAEAASRSADAALALLELQIERTIVRAPFTGVVGRRHVSLGDYVTSATPLLSLHTVDPQRAVIEVPERHATSLRRGQAVEFNVAAQPGRVFTAEVEFVDPTVQDGNRTILVKARAPNGDGVLRPGMFIEARLATGTRPGAVVVPEDAIQPLRTGNVIWVVADGAANRRVVQLGARARGMVEVLSGVDAGEQVVVGGLERMAEGAPLMPRANGAAADSPPEGESLPESESLLEERGGDGATP